MLGNAIPACADVARILVGISLESSNTVSMCLDVTLMLSDALPVLVDPELKLLDVFSYDGLVVDCDLCAFAPFCSLLLSNPVLALASLTVLFSLSKPKEDS